MKRSSILALCLTLLIGAFGSTASGQITQPQAGTYVRGPWKLILTPRPDGEFALEGVWHVPFGYHVTGIWSKWHADRGYHVTGWVLRDGRFYGWLHDENRDTAGKIGGTWSGSGPRITYIQPMLHFKTGPKRTVNILLAPAGQRVAQESAASAARPRAEPKPHPLAASTPPVAGGSFGLVSKVLGHVPPPAEGNNSITSGSMDERSFRIEVRMKPPYTGSAFVAHHYSSQLTSRLKPGQIVELTCWSEADRTSRDFNVGSGCQWIVEGAGAEIIGTPTKTFAGTASDGKFYSLSRAVTRFRVLNSGQIKVTAAQGGQLWGGSDNWNPATYVYKFAEMPTATIRD
jgi:hypothetical protein